MVIWCKSCGALLGVRDPLCNWSTDHSGLCAACLEKERTAPDHYREGDTADDAPLKTSDGSDPTANRS